MGDFVSRCLTVTIDPDSGETNKDCEPLGTLIKKRTLQPNEPPVFGIHMAIRVAGTISVQFLLKMKTNSGEFIHTNLFQEK